MPTRNVTIRELEWPCPRWALRRAPKSNAGSVDPRALRTLLDETFGPENWEMRLTHRPKIESDSEREGRRGAARVVVATAGVEITARSSNGAMVRGDAGAFTAQWKTSADNTGAAGAAELVLKSATTIAFKRAAARLGRRFGADTNRPETTYEKLCDDAQAASERAMKRADAQIENVLGTATPDALQIENAHAIVDETHRVDPWSSERWEDDARRRIDAAAHDTGAAHDPQ